MTVLEFLASYAALFLQRAEAERIGGITVLYNEDVDGNAYAHIGNQHGGIDLIVGFSLFMEMNHSYTPVLRDAEWELFKENIQEPEPKTYTCSGSGCDRTGEANYYAGADDRFYCGGSDRCIP